jgi:hypothetical protein
MQNAKCKMQNAKMQNAKKQKVKKQTAKIKTTCIINVETTVALLLNKAVLENRLYIVFKRLFK